MSTQTSTCNRCRDQFSRDCYRIRQDSRYECPSCAVARLTIFLQTPLFKRIGNPYTEIQISDFKRISGKEDHCQFCPQYVKCLTLGVP